MSQLAQRVMRHPGVQRMWREEVLKPFLAALVDHLQPYFVAGLLALGLLTLCIVVCLLLVGLSGRGARAVD